MKNPKLLYTEIQPLEVLQSLKGGNPITIIAEAKDLGLSGYAATIDERLFLDELPEQINKLLNNPSIGSGERDFMAMRELADSQGMFTILKNLGAGFYQVDFCYP